MASNRNDGAAPHSVQISADTQPNLIRGRKLLDQFRAKCDRSIMPWRRRSPTVIGLSNSYQFYRADGRWRHSTEMGKLQIGTLPPCGW
jgi:hypothetical protein